MASPCVYIGDMGVVGGARPEPGWNGWWAMDERTDAGTPISEPTRGPARLEGWPDGEAADLAAP